MNQNILFITILTDKDKSWKCLIVSENMLIKKTLEYMEEKIVQVELWSYVFDNLRPWLRAVNILIEERGGGKKR